MSFRLRSSYFSKKDIFQQLSEGWIWGSTIDTICNRVGASQIIYINNDKKIGCTRPRLSVDRIRSRIQLISRLFFRVWPDRLAVHGRGCTKYDWIEYYQGMNSFSILNVYDHLQLVENFSNWHYTTERKKEKSNNANYGSLVTTLLKVFLKRKGIDLCIVRARNKFARRK